MSLNVEYRNIDDETTGRRTASEGQSLVDNILRTTFLSVFVSLQPAPRFLDSIFLANYRDEAKAGTHAEPYLVYIIASPGVEGRKANRFESQVWFERVHNAREKVAALFSGKPVSDLPAALTRGKVRFDWVPRDGLVEITFPVPYRETAGSFESSCRSLEEILCGVWAQVMELSEGIESECTPDQMTGRVFLCHSSKDRPFVHRLADALKSAGVSVWLDEDEILVGSDFIERMADGLSRSQFVAVVLSPYFVSAGPWAQEEFRSALAKQVNENRTVVLPVLSKQCVIPALLSSKKYADFTKSFEYGLGQLLRAITCPPDDRISA